MDANLSPIALRAAGRSLYEGLFLVDSADALADWDAVVAAVTGVLERSEAEIVSIRKWDERRLTYKINGKTKGTYILCYFRVAGTKIQEIERNIQLSTAIWRALILNAEQQPQADIEKDTPLILAEKQREPAQSAADNTEAKQTYSAKQSQQPQQSGKTRQAEPAPDVSKAEHEDKKGRPQSDSQGGSD